MRSDRLSDDALASLEKRLNRYEPRDVRDALHAVRFVPRRTAGASGPLDFGSVAPGVLVYRDEAGVVRIRVTVAEMTGATYDEVELFDDEVPNLATAIDDRLVRTGAPRS
jgi:hypothetical protein